MKKKVFVTGASGFIGSNLIKNLSDDNDVYVLLRKPVEPHNDNIKIISGDILHPEGFLNALEGCDVMYHAAAFISFSSGDYQTAYKVNVEGTRLVLDAALKAGVKKVVHLSACAVLGYSDNKDSLLDESACPEISQDNVYAYTKKLAEVEVGKYVQMGLDVSIANISTVYGPGDANLNSGAIIKSIYEGKMKVVPPGGTSFVAVKDLVEGLRLLSLKGRPGERYIFSTENLEYSTLAERIAGALGVEGPKYTMPRFTFYPALVAAWCVERVARLKKDNLNLITTSLLRESYGYKYFSSKKAREELGWKPVVSLEEAVKSAFDYYKSEKLIA